MKGHTETCVANWRDWKWKKVDLLSSTVTLLDVPRSGEIGIIFRVFSSLKPIRLRHSPHSLNSSTHFLDCLILLLNRRPSQYPHLTISEPPKDFGEQSWTSFFHDYYDTPVLTSNNNSSSVTFWV